MSHQKEHDGTVDYLDPKTAAHAAVDDDDAEDDSFNVQELSLPPAEGTLLPAPIANAVSLATRSTSFALRLGTFVGGCGLGAAKFTTLSSLELGRSILEGILHRAGKDAVARSTSEVGRNEAETILEKSLESLHQTMTQIVFWTTASFHITGTTVSAVSNISQILLTVLDQFFGSTDSSKAIASIITLIRREFQNPATGVQGEKVGVTDLVLGICGLAYLQIWCRKLIEEDARRLCQEEIVWDVVVFDDSQGLDVHEKSLYGAHPGNYSRAGEAGVFEAIQRHGSHPDSDDEDEIPETYLKQQILASLPDDADVSISTSTTITKTITVEVKGAPINPLLAPAGLHVVESEVTTGGDSPWSDGDEPTYKVVYRVSRNKVRSTAQEANRNSRVEVIDDDEGAPLMLGSGDTQQELPQESPPVPPKDDIVPTRGSSTATRPEQVRSQSRAGAASRSQGSYIPMPRNAAENTANQKKARKPLGGARPIVSQESAPSTTASLPVSKNATLKKAKETEPTAAKPSDKKGGFRGVLKKGSVPSFSNLLNKDSSPEQLSQPATSSKPKSAINKPPWGSNKPAKQPAGPARGPIPNRDSSLLQTREPPRPPQRGNPNFFSSRDLAALDDGPGHQRSASRSSYVSIQGKRRNSVVSQTDTFSVHSFDSRPGSPSYFRSEIRTPGGMAGIKTGFGLDTTSGQHSPLRGHNRGRSHVDSMYSPSIYTLKTTGSQASVVLSSSFNQRSAYGDSKAVDTLRRTGLVDGMFPDFHILRNITRYSRYASAAYGSQFLRFMGISKNVPALKALDDTHQDVRYFAHHTELPPNSILLSSFVDPQGGSDSTGSTDTGVPLVHTIAVDQSSKAVVLSCRGTLGFEDVLADMMCEYDDLVWRGRSYKVHKGIHASARRLLYGGDGRVLLTLREALQEFPDYGLVLCGHSLGGAVTALLGMMLAEPASTGTAFVTSAHQHRRLLTGNSQHVAPESILTPISLPSGRPIHVYTYGPPATVSPALQRATRGLITSTVHGNDLVPYLSLGVLHDLQALALAFKTDNSDAKAEVRRRIWSSLQSGLADRWYNNKNSAENDGLGGGSGENAGLGELGDEEMKWAYAALKTLRASMMSAKLLPPGEVFCIESTPALRRDAFVARGESNGGKDGGTKSSPASDGEARKATRVVLKYVRDVEARFREVRFGASMLMDHSPGRYEDSLRRLMGGVCDY